jgi:hypothetical protein
MHDEMERAFVVDMVTSAVQREAGGETATASRDPMGPSWRRIRMNRDRPRRRLVNPGFESRRPQRPRRKGHCRQTFVLDAVRVTQNSGWVEYVAEADTRLDAKSA